MSTGISTAHVGIAGVNTRQLHATTLRIAGAHNGADQQCGSTALGASIVGGRRLGDPRRVPAPYDLSLRQLTRAERAAWGDRVAVELTDQFEPGTVVWFHAGAL